MAISTIYPNGTAEIEVPATESIAISNYGGGIAKIYYLIKNTNRPDAWQFQQTLENSAVTLGAFSSAQIVKIESRNSKVTYEVGTAPSTGSGDADTLGGELPAYYRNADNINAGTIADARLPATISSDITGNAATVGGEPESNLAKLDAANVWTATNNYFQNYINIGKNDGGDSIAYFYDDTNNAYRSFRWYDSISDWAGTDNGGTLRQIWHAGTNPSVGAGNGVSGTFTTADAKTVTVTNGIITSIV